MGIFSKIEKVKKYVGESRAKLSVSPENQINNGNEMFRFSVSCVIKDADLEIKKAYLKVKALEKVIVQNVQIAEERGDDEETSREAISSSHQTFCKKFKIIEHQVLKANQTYDWVVEVLLPREVNASYHGYNAHHEWKAYTGLEIIGEDPISDWISFEVRK